MALRRRGESPQLDRPAPSTPAIFTLGDRDRIASRQRYEHITTKGKARVHIGNAYNFQHHHYHGKHFVGSEEESESEDPEEISEEQVRAKAQKQKLKKAKAFSEALAFPQMGSRAASVATAFSKTCLWTIDKEE